MVQLKQEAYQIISFVAMQYGTQIYLLILFCRTLKFRKIRAKKIIKRLKLSPVFRDNLKIMKITYFNIEILELFILMLIWAMMSVCASILLNLNSITNAPMVLIDHISKPIRSIIFSFVPLVRYLMIFSMPKSLFVFMAKVFFNSTLILREVQRTKVLADRIKKTKEYSLSCLKSTTYYKFFYYFLRFQLYTLRTKFCKLRINSII